MSVIHASACPSVGLKCTTQGAANHVQDPVRVLKEGPLTEELAIALARSALEGEGIDTKMLLPRQHKDGRIFIQGADEDVGSIWWFPDPDVQPNRRSSSSRNPSFIPCAAAFAMALTPGWVFSPM